MYNIICHFTSGNVLKIERKLKQHAQLIEKEINAAHRLAGKTMYSVADTDKAEKLHLIFMEHLEHVEIDLISEDE